MSVDKILFCERTQRTFLVDILNALVELNTGIAIDKTTPLFGTTKSFSVNTVPERSSRGAAPITDIASVVINNNSVCMDTVTPGGLSNAITFMKWVTENNDVNPMIVTWAVLIALYLSDPAKDVVCSMTRPDIARAYLEKFDERFETYLCGKLQHNKAHKKSDLIRQAKSPTEIVLHEWLYVKQLYTGLAAQI